MKKEDLIHGSKIRCVGTLVDHAEPGDICAVHSVEVYEEEEWYAEAPAGEWILLTDENLDAFELIS